MAQDAGGGATGADDAQLVTDQAADSFTRRTLGGAATLRLLYQRCHEARAQALPGQDYAEVVSAGRGTSLRFCVADGVGGSYKGDFAARYLAGHLVRWLGALDAIPDDEAEVHARLWAALADWAAPGQAALRRIAFPAGTTELVGEVLAELREGHGSETVFIAGRVDRDPRPAVAPGEPRARALLCWMGDVSAELYAAAGQPVPLGQRGDDRDRWSTLRGPRGRLAVRSLSLGALHRLIVYTDGLGSVGPAIARLDDAALTGEAARLLSLPTSDDVTVLDVAWTPAAPPQQGAAGAPRHG